MHALVTLYPGFLGPTSTQGPASESVCCSQILAVAVISLELSILLLLLLLVLALIFDSFSCQLALLPFMLSVFSFPICLRLVITLVYTTTLAALLPQGCLAPLPCIYVCQMTAWERMQYGSKGYRLSL